MLRVYKKLSQQQLSEQINVLSFAQSAQKLMPVDVAAFINSGSHDELALKRNQNSFKDLLIAPRILRGVDQVSTDFTLFDRTMSAPLFIAPSAYQGLLSRGGELDMLEAANQFNTIMIVSMFSSVDYAEIAQRKKVPTWLQMYFLSDRAVNRNLIRMAEQYNYEALVVTVDAPVYAKKYAQRVHPLNIPEQASLQHLDNIGIPVAKCLQSKGHLSTLLDHTISWKDIEWLANETHLPIILKGIMHPQDSKIALEYDNVKGIVVSNHGGRQLDASYSPMEVLAQHKKIVGDSIKLFVDGGITHGSDIFKALAMGADATFIGRPALWGLASGASEGVLKILEILQDELREVMILSGCSCIDEIVSELLTLGE